MEDVRKFNALFVEDVKKGHICGECQLPLINPVQTIECGHRFCEKCLQANGQPCPSCNQPIKALFHDTACKKEILALKVKCQHSDKGCRWSGEFQYAKEHLAECQYGVYHQFMQGNLEKETYPQCEQCKQLYSKTRQEHEAKYCQQLPVLCPNCGDKIPRSQVQGHISRECRMTVVTCRYADEIGCPFKDIRANLEEHLDSSKDYHLELAITANRYSKEREDYLKQLLKELTDNAQDVKSRMSVFASGVQPGI